MKQGMQAGLSVLAIVLFMGLAGCGDKAEGGKATQVAAKVNGDEITVHQLNLEMSRLGNISPEKAKEAASQVLKSIVDQQLLVQQAIDSKLDRDPRVVQILEANRRQVLAQAYLQQKTDKIASPGEAEINDYYAKHPELFSERRIYRLQELSVPLTPDNTEMVKAKLASSGNINEFGKWLREQKIQSRVAQSVKPAEQLPLEVLSRLHQLKDGQVLTLATGNSINIILVAGSQSQPISEVQAKPTIERFLTNAKKREASAGVLQGLHAKADIEYMGDYRAVGEQQTAKVPDAKQANPVVAGAATESTAATDRGVIDKGLQGLK
jgi:EpsD family peptidyl-prolyl cis-trans isomerase